MDMTSEKHCSKHPVLLKGTTELQPTLYLMIAQENTGNYSTTVKLIFKVVIINDLGKDKNQHKMLKIQQIFPKLYRFLLYIVFHNYELQNAGLVNDKKDLN